MLLLVAGSFMLACNKKPFDYRNKYLGEWAFEVERRSYSMDTSSPGYWDTFFYTGRIDYADAGNALRVHYTPEDTVTVQVEEDGKVTSLTYLGYGEFSDEKNFQM